MSFLRLQCQDFLKERSVKKIHLFIYLFIYYKLRQEAWITHRGGSTTRSRKKKKEKKISNTTSKNEKYFRNDKKKN